MKKSKKVNKGSKPDPAVKFGNLASTIAGFSSKAFAEQCKNLIARFPSFSFKLPALPSLDFQPYVNGWLESEDGKECKAMMDQLLAISAILPEPEFNKRFGTLLGADNAHEFMVLFRAYREKSKTPQNDSVVADSKPVILQPTDKPKSSIRTQCSLSELIESKAFQKKITPLPKFDQPNSKWITSRLTATELGISEGRLSNLRSKNDQINYRKEEYAGFIIGRSENNLIWCKSSQTSKTIFYLLSEVKKLKGAKKNS